MKKNNRLLKHLYSTFYLFYILSVLGLAGTIVFIPLNLIIGLDSTSQFEFSLMSSLLELPINYTLNGDTAFKGVGMVEIMPETFVSNNIGYRFLAFLNNIAMFLCAFLVTKQFKDIFHTLSVSQSMREFFVDVNYMRIRKIAFITLAYILYKFLVAVVFSYFLVEDIYVMGKLIHLHPDYFNLLGILSFLITLVIAEVYKAGIKLKEESELTI
jgi:hypothetical protein